MTSTRPIIGPVTTAAERRAELGAVGFWERLPVLVAHAGPPDRAADRPPTDLLLGLRQLLANRRSDATRALFRVLAHSAGQRVEAVVDEHFESLLSSDERGCVVREVFFALFEGGLAGFRGRDAEALLDFVHEHTDRAVLRAAVAKWGLKEVRSAWRSRYQDLLSSEEMEELSGDVLGELLWRSLGRFRGATGNELYVYVRTMCRRSVGRAARRKILDRQSISRLQQEAPPGDPPLLGRPQPQPPVRLRGEGGPPPISATDQAYLEALLRAGGKLSALAEQRGVTRSSVTKMVQRILARLDALEPQQREQVGDWATQILELRA
jgi:hypothetical protein